MRRVSQGSRTVKKKKNSFPTDGLIFRQKSLLNKRGSECFSTGTCIIRLQDFSDNLNTFNNTVWTVVNHNLIRKYEYISKNGIYDYFKPTDRYTRWLPQFANDYIGIDNVIEIEGEDEEYKIGVCFPAREKIIERFEESTRDRRTLGLPPVISYDASENGMAESHPSVSESTQPTATPTTTTASFSTSSAPSFTFEVPPQSSADYYYYDDGASSNNNNSFMYDPNDCYYFVDDFSDLQNMDDNVFYVNDDNSVDIKPDIPAPSDNVMEESQSIVPGNTQPAATPAPTASSFSTSSPISFTFDSTPQSSAGYYYYDDGASDNMYDASNTYYYIDDYSDPQNMDDNVFYVNDDSNDSSTGYKLFI